MITPTHPAHLAVGKSSSMIASSKTFCCHQEKIVAGSFDCENAGRMIQSVSVRLRIPGLNLNKKEGILWQSQLMGQRQANGWD